MGDHISNGEIYGQRILQEEKRKKWRKEIGGEEEVEVQEYREAETDGLIREYQKNAKPT